MRLLYFPFLISFSMAQEMQVRYVSAYTFDAKWAGEFEIVIDQIRAPGYYRSNEKFSPKKWIFRWYYTEEGSIEIAGTDNRLGYNAKSKEYWIEPPKNHFCSDHIFAGQNEDRGTSWFKDLIRCCFVGYLKLIRTKNFKKQ